MGNNNSMKYLLILFVSVVLGQIPEYDRVYFKHWFDEDLDGQDTRVEVLIEESLSDVVYMTDKEEKVKFGMWHCKYTDTLVFNPRALDIDHHVPLFDAWISGAWAWDNNMRNIYANYLDDPNHLIAVYRSANRSKGSRSPDQWLPEYIPYRVEYCHVWCKIKVKWKLTVTSAELRTLKAVLKHKNNIVYPKVRNERERIF